jgi:paraquat-inducible protein B
MSVNLDYRPGTAARLSGHGGEAVEIPTVPSDLESLEEQLRKLDLPALSQRMAGTLASMQRVLDDIDGKIDPLASSVQTTLATTNSAVLELQKAAARTSADIERLSDESRSQIRANGRDLDQLLRAADRTVEQADALVVSLRTISSPRGDLQASLRDLAASASSLRDLTHDLDHAPLRTLLRKDKQ